MTENEQLNYPAKAMKTKNKYIQPAAEIIDFSPESQLLENSGNPTYVRGDETLGGDQALSGHKGWNSSDWSD